jgi:hypothetical protein
MARRHLLMARYNHPAVAWGANMKLRFSVRDLLWLVVVMALAVGWWLDHRRLTTDDGGVRLFIGGAPMAPPASIERPTR